MTPSLDASIEEIERRWPYTTNQDMLGLLYSVWPSLIAERKRMIDAQAFLRQRSARAGELLNEFYATLPEPPKP